MKSLSVRKINSSNHSSTRTNPRLGAGFILKAVTPSVRLLTISLTNLKVMMKVARI